MAKLDRIKREIDFREKMFLGTTAALLALIGWLGGNYTRLQETLLVLSLLATLVIGGFGIYQYHRIKHLLEELEHV